MWIIVPLILGVGGFFWYQSTRISPAQATSLANAAMANETNPQNLVSLSQQLRSQGYANQADALLTKANVITGGQTLLGQSKVAP